MAYDPNLNRLIALGGQRTASPVQRYYQGRDQGTREDMNRLGMESTRQSMGIQADQESRDKSIMKMKQRASFGTSIAPIMQEILAEPNAIKQQAMYQKATPLITKMALDNEIPTANMPTAFNPQFANQVVQNYGAEQWKTRKRGEAYTRVSQKSGKEEKILAAKGPLSSTNVYSGSNPYMKQLAADFIENKKKVPTAVKSLKNLETMESLLDKGMITGSLANVQLGVGNFLKKAGIWDDKKNLLENTQSYFSSTAKETANIIKDFGAGTGLSDADREYALKAAGGDITMTPEALRNIISINRRATLNSLANWNQEVDLQPDQMLPNKNRFKVTIPEQYMETMEEYDENWGYTGRSGSEWGYSKAKKEDKEPESEVIEVEW